MTARLQAKTQTTIAIAEAIGTRHCVNHSGPADINQGSYVMRGKTRQWMCFRCQVKTGRRKAMPATIV